MRKAVGSTWIFSLVITFTLIFTAFLSLALNYSKAYKLKNEMTTMIEKYEGITTTEYVGKGKTKVKSDKNIQGSINIINTYLKNNGYVATGVCSKTGDEEVYGVSSLESGTLEKASAKKKYYYCISYSKASIDRCTYIFGVKIFFNFNLPVFGRIKQFSISGKTNEIYSAYFVNKALSCKK